MGFDNGPSIIFLAVMAVEHRVFFLVEVDFVGLQMSQPHFGELGQLVRTAAAVTATGGCCPSYCAQATGGGAAKGGMRGAVGSGGGGELLGCPCTMSPLSMGRGPQLHTVCAHAMAGTNRIVNWIFVDTNQVNLLF